MRLSLIIDLIGMLLYMFFRSRRSISYEHYPSDVDVASSSFEVVKTSMRPDCTLETDSAGFPLSIFTKVMSFLNR